MKKYYPGEKLGNHHKKGKGKLPLFRGNIEQVIPIYGSGGGLGSCQEGKGRTPE